jgi:predicted transglutaminase-like cysteine proteinase
MSIKSVLSVVVVLLCGAQAHAVENQSANMKLFGKSLPPIGYVKFCATGEVECQLKGSAQDRLVLTQAKWELLDAVNSSTNSKITPESDQDLYGVAENWTYPTTAGDCEDYALLKQRELQAMGVPADELLITVLLDEKNEGHAVLTVVTDKGDFILDNRHNDILRWDHTPYTFLKRQSQVESKLWVSLRQKPTQVLVSSQ